MPSPTRRQREEARRRANAAALQRHRSVERRRRLLALGVVVVVLLSGTAGLIAATRSSSTKAPASSTTTASTIPVPANYPATGVAPVPADPGLALSGPTPCPPEDGSAPRTTSFAEPPPTCIDTNRFYSAVVTTTAGPITFQLNPQRAPQPVNAFVVLAGYHFYDGQPVTKIQPRGWFEASGLFADGQAPVGFPVPDENPPQGQIFTPGTIALFGQTGVPGTNRGGFLVATFESAPAIDQGVSSFGIMLDGAATLTAIDRLGSQDGQPTQPVRIESVLVTPGAPIA